MIGSNPSGVVAVIGRDHQHVSFSQARQDLAKGGIEPFKVSRIPRNVSAVAIQAVEFHKISKCQAAIHRSSDQICQMRHQFCIRAPVHFIKSLHGKDVAHFAQPVNAVPGVLNPIAQNWGRGHDGIVMAIGCTLKGAG